MSFTPVLMLNNASTASLEGKSHLKQEDESEVSDNNEHDYTGGGCHYVPLEKELKTEAVSVWPLNTL